MDSSTSGIVEQVDRLLDAASPVVDLGDDELRVRVVECEQAMLMLQATQADAMVAMGRRARAADQAEAAGRGEPMWSGECREEFVPDEIGVLLGCTKMAASIKYGTACGAAELPVLAEAWRAGRVDARKVAVIVEQVACLDLGTAKEVAADAVGYATRPNHPRTAPQLREWLRGKVIAADPEAAEERRRRAMGDRRVVITPGDDGMSELWALLPGVQARQIQTALTTASHDLGADDARSMDQRRADTLVDLLLGRGDPPAVSLQLIVTSDTITGASQQPGWVPGLGPVTTTEITELIGTGAGDGAETGAGAGTDAGTGLGSHVTVRPLLTDPATGILIDLDQKSYRPSAALDRAVRARDVTCWFPGCRRSADSAGTDLDHTVPWPGGATTATNLAVLCRRHHRLKHSGGWNLTQDPNAVMTWTTPTGRHYQTDPWTYTNPDPPPDG